ncbi:hypothetical protein [Gimesia algae]|uniref:Uncharacterized protein n=1 Tax=Gimesia algae TaxID=2527971 RepID=A0A517VEC5_9PLAN|nr:hypothetical protein [Gimesia algae]QDT91362.1 hypothetical protein Pan161_30190 [Gimesia algae]
MKSQNRHFILGFFIITGLVSPTHGETPSAATLEKPAYTNTQCEGTYPHHLQGLCVDGQGNIFWSFTTQLVKTNSSGKVLVKIPVGNHHGDLCYHAGKVFVAVNFGDFNNPAGKADSWVYVYDLDKLLLIAKHQTPEVTFGAGGIACHAGKFLVVGGLPKGVNENYLYEYDSSFKFIKKHVLKSGYTLMGIQTATFAENKWWFGCYGSELLTADVELNFLAKYDLDCALGIDRVNDKLLLIGRNTKKGKVYTGKALLAVPDTDKGFVIQK